jgi:hypothetical protein
LIKKYALGVGDLHAVIFIKHPQQVLSIHANDLPIHDKFQTVSVGSKNTPLPIRTADGAMPN